MRLLRRRAARVARAQAELDRRHRAVARPWLLGGPARPLPRPHGEGARGLDRARRGGAAIRRSASSSSRTAFCSAGWSSLLAVRPEAAGQGVGRALMEHVAARVFPSVRGSSSRATRPTRARCLIASSAFSASGACPISSSRSASSSCCARAAATDASSPAAPCGASGGAARPPPRPSATVRIDVALRHLGEVLVEAVQLPSSASLRASTSMSRLLAPCTAATISLSLSWTASESLFCERWMRNTIRNVTIVVPVLMTSCQVSDRKSGPVTSQMTMMTRRSRRPTSCPSSR